MKAIQADNTHNFQSRIYRFKIRGLKLPTLTSALGVLDFAGNCVTQDGLGR
jgi:hypothetical protein